MSVFPRRLAAAAVLALGATSCVATAAQAAPQLVTYYCDGHEVQVRVPTTQAAQSWGAMQIVDGGSGHLIPLVVDVKNVFIGSGPVVPISHSVKGGGNAGPTGPTVTCESYEAFIVYTRVTTVTAVARP